VRAAPRCSSFGIKAAVFPYYYYRTRRNPARRGRGFFGGMLTKVGVYRCSGLHHLPKWRSIPRPWVAAGTIPSGSSVRSPRRHPADPSFHIISQVGYMIMGLALASQLGIAGGIFYILHHIVVKVGLILVGGAIEETHGTGRLERLGGIARTNGLLALVFVICALSLAGVPPFSGFFAKLLLIRAGLEAGQPGIVAVSILVSVLTLMSMLKIYTNVFWGGRSEIKPSEVLPSAYAAWCMRQNIDPNRMREDT
jgi:multicomponent Na+:H+ antiporter subunit D